MKLNKQQNEALYGPSIPSDYSDGDSIQYVDGDTIQEGTVLFTRAAGPVREGGPVLQAGHVVSNGRGWLEYVPLKRVVQE